MKLQLNPFKRPSPRAAAAPTVINQPAAPRAFAAIRGALRRTPAPPPPTVLRPLAEFVADHEKVMVGIEKFRRESGCPAAASPPEKIELLSGELRAIAQAWESTPTGQTSDLVRTFGGAKIRAAVRLLRLESEANERLPKLRAERDKAKIRLPDETPLPALEDSKVLCLVHAAAARGDRETVEKLLRTRGPQLEAEAARELAARVKN